MLDVALSVNYLLKRDPSLKELFYNPPIENLYPESNFFQSIIRSIVYQQLVEKLQEKFIRDLLISSN